MNIDTLLDRIHDQFEGLNGPASDRELARLRDAFGYVPEEVLCWYRDHDGSAALPRRGDVWLSARLTPIDELLSTHQSMEWFVEENPSLGSVIWFWTDDNSNYCGVYTDGPLKGWLTRLDHDEPILVPAYRSAAAFLASLLTGCEQEAVGLGMLTPEVPAVAPEPTHTKADQELAAMFRCLYHAEADDNQRRLYAYCTICLTPPDNTADVLSFLRDVDIWIPERAVQLLELRNYQGGIELLEKLAREGSTNGDSAAMRQLVRLQNDESRHAIARLKHELSGKKLQILEMWANSSHRLQPPRWP